MRFCRPVGASGARSVACSTSRRWRVHVSGLWSSDVVSVVLCVVAVSCRVPSCGCVYHAVAHHSCRVSFSSFAFVFCIAVAPPGVRSRERRAVGSACGVRRIAAAAAACATTRRARRVERQPGRVAVSAAHHRAARRRAQWRRALLRDARRHRAVHDGRAKGGRVARGAREPERCEHAVAGP